MREHIGKMCDRLNKRKKEEAAQLRRKLTKSPSSFSKDLGGDSFPTSQRGFVPSSDSTIPSKSAAGGETEKMGKQEDDDDDDRMKNHPDDGITTLKAVSAK